MKTRVWGARARARLARGELRRNLGLKLGSVVLAFLVWYATNVLERDAERIVDVPVVARQVPSELTLVDVPSTPVAITLRGPRTLLEGVEESRLRLVLPVRGISAGTNRVDLQAGHVEPELPRRLRVVRLQPGRLEVRAEPLHRRRVPVRVELAGRPAFGYSVVGSQVVPDAVEVAGPAGVVDQLRAVQTVPIELRGLEATTSRSVAFEWVGDYVQFEPDRARVTINLREVIVSREFRKVPVKIRGAEGAKVTPPTLSLTLRGPQRIVEGFVVPEDAASVDASGLAPGTHQVEVAVTVPSEIEVVTRTPEVHRLVLPKRESP